MSIFNFKKGLDCYGYVGAKAYAIDFSQAGEGVGVSIPGEMKKLEIEIIPTTETLNFKWDTIDTKNGQTLVTRSADISAITGNLGECDFSDMLKTTSVINDDYSLSHGFYDAGSGYEDKDHPDKNLTNRDQAYVYLTDNHSNWMGDLMKENSEFSKAKLAVFALPGAHDAGMFDPACIESILSDATALSSFLTLYAPLFAGILALEEIARPSAIRLAINFAFTQKDDITTMLDLGIRYFDFRPAFCHEKFRAVLGTPQIYHQHAIVPGYPYLDFLVDILEWLRKHSTEIVVVNLNFQGLKLGSIEDTSMKPSEAQLKSILKDAQDRTPTSQDIVAVFDAEEAKKALNESIATLIQDKKRLIFLNQFGEDQSAPTNKLDSYKDSYNTTDVQNIIDALNNTKTQQTEKDYIVLQLQGTATDTYGARKSVILNAANVINGSSAISPLMSTKAAFDHQTYPWLLNNVTNGFPIDKLVVFLNDFVDNALVDHAIRITKERILKAQ